MEGGFWAEFVSTNYIFFFGGLEGFVLCALEWWVATLVWYIQSNQCRPAKTEFVAKAFSTNKYIKVALLRPSRQGSGYTVIVTLLVPTKKLPIRFQCPKYFIPYHFSNFKTILIIWYLTWLKNSFNIKKIKFNNNLIKINQLDLIMYISTSP